MRFSILFLLIICVASSVRAGWYRCGTSRAILAYTAGQVRATEQACLYTGPPTNYLRSTWAGYQFCDVGNDDDYLSRFKEYCENYDFDGYKLYCYRNVGGSPIDSTDCYTNN